MTHVSLMKKIKRYKPSICFGTLILGLVVLYFFVTIEYRSISFRDEMYDVYWLLSAKKDYTKNYFEFSSCSPSFASQLINNKSAKLYDIKLVDLNPRRHSCYVQLSDEQIIHQCINNTFINYNSFSDWSLFPTHHPNPPLKENDMDKILQKKYNHRVIEEGGCLFPKGMWGNPFNSRCTVVTMAKIGNYKPNDLILDWGSGCGHQATWMTRLKVISKLYSICHKCVKKYLHILN